MSPTSPSLNVQPGALRGQVSVPKPCCEALGPSPGNARVRQDGARLAPLAPGRSLTPSPSRCDAAWCFVPT